MSQSSFFPPKKEFGPVKKVTPKKGLKRQNGSQQKVTVILCHAMIRIEIRKRFKFLQNEKASNNFDFLRQVDKHFDVLGSPLRINTIKLIQTRKSN